MILHNKITKKGALFVKYFLLSISALIIIALTMISFTFYQKPEFFMTSPLGFTGTDDTADSSPEVPAIEALQPVDYDKSISYSLQNEELHITYNRSEDWVKAPVGTEQLFSGEYQGNKQELMEHSYVLTEDRAAFLSSNQRLQGILLTYSTDRGETWETSVVSDTFPAMRFRKVDFLNDQFGYVIVSGDRTMSQEFSTVFLTHDGGETWQETNNAGVTRMIADGGFVDESTGFLSFGTIDPVEPTLYVTQNGGGSWQEAAFNIPDEYDHVFVISETPVQDGAQLSVLVNQGPNGDYAGGFVKGKFISEDNGETWDFQEEVEPNEAE